MKRNKLKLQKGFTIIEVMIVLAIAGLIMVIVFVAVPQLQRSERNTARKNVVDRIKTEVDNYSSNSNGNVPVSTATLNAVVNRYLNGVNINDPSSGNPMVITYHASGASAMPGTTPTGGNLPVVGTVYYRDQTYCNGEALVTGSNRNYALWTQLEGGAIQCLDNQ